MFTTTDPFNRKPVRTCRGEMPDKKRHPRSSSSANVMVGFRKLTRLHITTFVLNCKTMRHQINQEVASKIKFWLLVVGCSSTILEIFQLPRPGAREIRTGTLRMRDHGCALSYSIN